MSGPDSCLVEYFVYDRGAIFFAAIGAVFVSAYLVIDVSKDCQPAVRVNPLSAGFVTEFKESLSFFARHFGIIDEAAHEIDSVGFGANSYFRCVYRPRVRVLRD